MFNQELWHNQIVESLNAFTRSPWQDVQLSGARTLLGYLAVRTLEPFIEAFHQEPINAVMTLASITSDAGADHIVRRAQQLRFQGARLIERDFRNNPDLCSAVEHLIVSLNVVHLARQRLNSSRDEWLRQTLMSEIVAFSPRSFEQIQRLLQDPGWKLRHNAICNLKDRQGSFTPAELILLSEALKDSSSDVRTAAARRLGEFAQTPPTQLVRTLMHVALHDRDMQTRYAAARALGNLRERIASPEILEELLGNLSNEDNFVRSATVMVLVELGDLAGITPIIRKLVALLKDYDSYVQEAAAHALGRMGTMAVTREVMDALAQAMEEGDSAVHEAALESLIQLRKLRSSQPMHSGNASEHARGNSSGSGNGNGYTASARLSESAASDAKSEQRTSAVRHKRTSRQVA